MKTRDANAFVNVATFDTIEDAEPLKGWLIKERLPAYIKDERKLQRFWFGAKPEAGIHVQTTKDSFEKVELLLGTGDAAPVLPKAVRCPSCRSLRVEYPDLTRKNLLPSLFVGFFVLLHITRHKYYCEDCHYSWIRGNTSRKRNEAPLPT